MPEGQSLTEPSSARLVDVPWGAMTDQAWALASTRRAPARWRGTRSPSTSRPLSVPSDRSFNGAVNGIDAFVTRLDMLPTGVSAFGRSSPGCAGPLAISVNSMPRVPNANFAVSCGNAPPNTIGLLALTDREFQSPVVLLGIMVWIDPSTLWIPFQVTSNYIGASEMPLLIPNNPWVAGIQHFTQSFWAGPTSPAPCPPLGFSASNALDITIQP